MKSVYALELGVGGREAKHPRELQKGTLCLEFVLLDFWLHLGSASLSCIFSLPSFLFSPTHPWSNPLPLPSTAGGWGGAAALFTGPAVFLIWGEAQRAGTSAEVLVSGWVPSRTAGLQAASLGPSIYPRVLPPPSAAPLAGSCSAPLRTCLQFSSRGEVQATAESRERLSP